MLDVDLQFIHTLSTRTIEIKDKGSGVFLCRCPLCGDSQRNKHRARGYFLPNVALQTYWFYCHNCATQGIPFQKFLEQVDRSLYTQYKMAVFGSRYNRVSETVQVKREIAGHQYLDQLVPVSELASTHPVRQYCVRRHIPLHEAFWSKNPAAWAAQFVEPKEKLGVLRAPDYVIFPLRSQVSIAGFHLGAIDGSEPKYITFPLSDEPMIFGLHKVDLTKPIHVLEGVIDSLHLRNGIAVLKGCLSNTHTRVTIPKHQLVICHDNERHNIHVVHAMKRTIRNGLSICIFPNEIDAKDLNVLSVNQGWDNDRIQEFIEGNTYVDAYAKLAFARWRNI